MPNYTIQLSVNLLYTECLDASTQEEAAMICKDRIICAMRRLTGESSGIYSPLSLYQDGEVIDAEFTTQECGNCRCFKDGFCRLNPPQLIPGELDAVSRFPIIDKEDWCGKWEPKN